MLASMLCWSRGVIHGGPLQQACVQEHCSRHAGQLLSGEESLCSMPAGSGAQALALTDQQWHVRPLLDLPGLRQCRAAGAGDSNALALGIGTVAVPACVVCRLGSGVRCADMAVSCFDVYVCQSVVWWLCFWVYPLTDTAAVWGCWWAEAGAAAGERLLYGVYMCSCALLRFPYATSHGGTCVLVVL